MAVSAGLVKELREKTNVGMMECKKALEETNGDMEAAIKVLRERGIAKAAKREGRTAAEGVIAATVNSDNTSGVVVELNSETDFVARNEEFIALVRDIAGAALATQPGDMAALLNVKMGTRTVGTAVDDIRTKIGEKIDLSSYERVAGDVVAGYVHPPGRIGVLVTASAANLAPGKSAAVVETLREIAMHIAAFNPRFLDGSQVDTATLDGERDVFAALARNEGKPEAIIPKIVDGKIKSFYKENCLVEQAFAKDPSKTVGDVVKEAAKAAGADIKLTGFVRVAIGAKAAPAGEQ